MVNGKLIEPVIVIDHASRLCRFLGYGFRWGCEHGKNRRGAYRRLACVPPVGERQERAAGMKKKLCIHLCCKRERERVSVLVYMNNVSYLKD